MPASAEQMLDQLHGLLSRISSQMVAAATTDDDALSQNRYRHAQEDVEKTMPLVRRIKAKVSSDRQIKMDGVVATGAYAKAAVWTGRKKKTASDLAKQHLKKNRKGKVVSKSASAAGEAKRKYIQEWLSAVRAARQQLGFGGFCLVGGKTENGQRLLETARGIYGKRGCTGQAHRSAQREP